MTFHEFIFSEEKPQKLRRHVTFWIVFTIQYYLQSLVPITDLFYIAMVSTICYVPACVIAVYAIKLRLQKPIEARKYFIFVAGLFALTVLVIAFNYLMSIFFFKLTCNCLVTSLSATQFIQIANINSAHAMTIGIIVLGFSVTKKWIVKQKKNQGLMNLKLANELQLQKANIYPDLLLSSLHNLHLKLISGSRNSPETIVRLSDLLSYLLYESNEKSITVEKEASMISNLVAIENMNRASQFLIDSRVSSSSNEKHVRPLIMFLFLQNCFSLLERDREQLYIQLEVSTDDQRLHSILTFEKGKKSVGKDWNDFLTLISERLEACKHEILCLKHDEEGSKNKIVFDIQLAS